MKSLKLVLFFGAILILLLPFQGMCQEAIQTATQSSLGFFGKIGEWLKSQATGIGFGLLMTYLGSKGYLAIIKRIANKGRYVLKEVSDLAGAGATFLGVIDDSISADNKVKENSIDELTAAGKEVQVEVGHLIMTVKTNPDNPSVKAIN